MALPSKYRSDQFVKNVLGPATSGAHVYWLTQPAGTIPAIEPLGGFASAATIYTDSSGGTTMSQPVQTDSFGHCDAYIASGIYTIVVYNNGTLQATYPDQSIAVAGQAASSGVNSLNALQGDVTIQAGSNISVTVAGQGIQISTTGGASSSFVYANGNPIEDNVIRCGSGTLDGTGHLVITFTGAAVLNNSFTYSVTCSYQNNSGSETKPLVAFCTTSSSTLDVKGDASKGFSFIVFADGTSS